MKLKINWAIPGLLAMIVIIVGIAWVQSLAATAPDPAKLANQCSACHTMDNHVTTWQASSHKEVACTSCHADPGVKGWVQMQLGWYQMKVANKSGNVELHKIATEVPNQRCLDCHAREMPWVMQDLKPAKLDEQGEPIRVEREELTFLRAMAGHDLHLTMKNPLSCTQCHVNVSHGPAPEVRVDRITQWHNLCLDCHATEKVSMAVRTSISCSACHVDLEKISPQDHKDANFRVIHGKGALENLATCQQCHLNPGITAAGGLGPHGSVKDALLTEADKLQQFLVKAAGSLQESTIPNLHPGSIKVPDGIQDACASCHGITMPHPQAWLTQHTTGFRENPALCASCHGHREQGFNMNISTNPRTLATDSASCTGCHAQPMPHPENWNPEAHVAAAKLAPASCAQCHSAANEANRDARHASPQFCMDCHQSKFRHPKGYIASHKLIVVANNGNQLAAGCTQCHTPQQNSCAQCHTDGFSQKQQWHPPNFWIKHAQSTKPSDVVSCKNCHDYIQPSCSECHRKY